MIRCDLWIKRWWQMGYFKSTAEFLFLNKYTYFFTLRRKLVWAKKKLSQIYRNIRIWFEKRRERTCFTKVFQTNTSKIKHQEHLNCLLLFDYTVIYFRPKISKKLVWILLQILVTAYLMFLQVLSIPGTYVNFITLISPQLDNEFLYNFQND